jgi:hypothetical protein
MHLKLGNREFYLKFELFENGEVVLGRNKTGKSRTGYRDITRLEMVEIRNGQFVQYGLSETARKPSERFNKNLGRYYAMIRILPLFGFDSLSRAGEFIEVYVAEVIKKDKNFEKVLNRIFLENIQSE